MKKIFFMHNINNYWNLKKKNSRFLSTVVDKVTYVEKPLNVGVMAFLGFYGVVLTALTGYFFMSFNEANLKKVALEENLSALTKQLSALLKELEAERLEISLLQQKIILMEHSFMHKFSEAVGSETTQKVLLAAGVSGAAFWLVWVCTGVNLPLWLAKTLGDLSNDILLRMAPNAFKVEEFKFIDGFDNVLVVKRTLSEAYKFWLTPKGREPYSLKLNTITENWDSLAEFKKQVLELTKEYDQKVAHNVELSETISQLTEKIKTLGEISAQATSDVVESNSTLVDAIFSNIV